MLKPSKTIQALAHKFPLPVISKTNVRGIPLHNSSANYLMQNYVGTIGHIVAEIQHCPHMGFFYNKEFYPIWLFFLVTNDLKEHACH